jgi:hypothetical protein
MLAKSEAASSDVRKHQVEDATPFTMREHFDFLQDGVPVGAQKQRQFQ